MNKGAGSGLERFGSTIPEFPSGAQIERQIVQSQLLGLCLFQSKWVPSGMVVFSGTVSGTTIFRVSNASIIAVIPGVSIPTILNG
jgi:hypothetical protein